jgi:hypothetical protein
MIVSTENPKGVVTRIADANMNRWHFVEATANRGCAIAGADADAIGILQDDALLGQEVGVATKGLCKVIAGGVIAVGDMISSGAAGTAVVAVAGPEIAQAMEAAAAGDIFQVQMLK